MTMNLKNLRPMLGALLFTMAALAIPAPQPVQASPVPAAATITLANDSAHPIQWSGGPLLGTADDPNSATTTNEFWADAKLCSDADADGRVDSNCEDFILNVDAASPDADHLAVLTIQASTPPGLPTGSVTCAWELNVYEPWATDLATDFERVDCLGSPPHAVFPAPAPGQWRIRTVCHACVQAEYNVSAWTSVVAVPDGPRPMGSPHFSETRLYGAGAVQPRMAMDSSGNVFVTSAALLPGHSAWRVATDGDVYRASRIDGWEGGDDVTVAADGTVYVMGQQGPPRAFSPVVYVSTDHGSSYARRGFFGPDADHAYLGAGPGGLLYAVSMTFNDGPRLILWGSNDHAWNFTVHGAISASHPVTACAHPERPLVDPTDPSGRTVYVIYRDSTEEECENQQWKNWRPEIWAAKTTDGGVTWTHTQVKTSNGLLTTYNTLLGAAIRGFSAAIDPAGHLYAVWTERPNPCGPPVPPCLAPPPITGDSTVWMARSLDGAVSWQGPFRVDQRPTTLHGAFTPEIAAPGGGVLDFAWYASPVAALDDPAGNWSVAFARSADADAASPIFSEAMATREPVHLGQACGGASAWCPNETGLDLAVAPDGTARLTWSSDVGGSPLNILGIESGH